MSQTISLPDELIERIDRFASRLGNGTTRSKASQILIDESLREQDFAGIEFRNTAIGRQAFVKQTGMTVWEMIMVARGFNLDAASTAEHFELPVEIVQAALRYYQAYRSEIDTAIAENDKIGEEELRRAFPNLRVFGVSATNTERTA